MRTEERSFHFKNTPRRGWRETKAASVLREPRLSRDSQHASQASRCREAYPSQTLPLGIYSNFSLLLSPLSFSAYPCLPHTLMRGQKRKQSAAKDKSASPRKKAQNHVARLETVPSGPTSSAASVIPEASVRADRRLPRRKSVTMNTISPPFSGCKQDKHPHLTGKLSVCDF